MLIEIKTFKITFFLQFDEYKKLYLVNMIFDVKGEGKEERGSLLYYHNKKEYTYNQNKVTGGKE